MSYGQLKQSKNRYIAIIVAIFMMFTMLALPVGAADLDLQSSYAVLKTEYPEVITKLQQGGATEADIQNFLTSLENDLKTKGTLTEANFNSYMYQSLQEVLTYRSNQNLLHALLSEFADEIDYTMDNKELAPGLVPLRNAVMKAMLGNGDTPDTKPSTGNSSSSGSNTSSNSSDTISQEIQKQIKTSASTVRINIDNNTSVTTIKGSLLNEIWAAKKGLEISISGVIISLPQEALIIANGNSLSLSVTPVSTAKRDEIMNNVGAEFRLLGQIYEISITTESSLDSVNFQKPISLTLSYVGSSTEGLDKSSLDVFYYNESLPTWEKMNGTIDQTKKTITFTTNHVSKYAILSQKPSKFSDLPASHWACADIEAMLELGLVNGISSTEFAPQRNITRAEFSALLLRVLGISSTTQLYGRFNDVATDEWYFNVVNKAADLGLVNGYTAKTFGPNDPITREQIAVMVSRALEYSGRLSDKASIANLNTFADRQLVSSWALEGVSVAVQQGIIKGRSTTQFAPLENATRAEAAVMIYRMLPDK